MIKHTPEGFEQRRLQDLKSLQILDTLPEKEYDTITSLAASICDTPISLVSLVTDTKQFFKSHKGLDTTETSIDHSFCAHAIKTPDALFIVEDARKDVRFKDNPLVTGNPNMVFYAGIPLVSSKGNALGTLFVIDDKPRKLEPNQLSALESLVHQVVQLFELRKNRIELIEVGNALSVESQHLKNIIDATRIGTWEWNIESGLVRISDRCAEMLGYTLEELGPIHVDLFQKLLYPKDVQSNNDKITACLEKKTDYYEGVYRYFHKMRHIIWISARGKVVRWSDKGEPLVMSGAIADITERKTTEKQFNTIINNIPGVVYRYKLFPDGTDKLMLVSDGAKVLWGFSAEEVMQDSNLIWEYCVKDDLVAAYHSIQKSAEDLSFWEHEWRYHDPDGKIKWCKGSGNPFRTQDGGTTWDSIILDITAQKENQLEVEQSQKRFKGLVQNGSGLISILDSEAKYKYLSTTHSVVLGIPAEEFLGTSFFESIHPDDKEAVSASLERIATEKQVVLDPFRFKHGDGLWRWLETVITNLMDYTAIKGLVANSRDITEQTRNNEKLKKSEGYYRGLYESKTYYVLRTDLKGNYTYVSKKFIEEFGWLYPDEKILKKNIFVSIKDYHHQKTKEIIRQCIAEPEKVFKLEIDKPTSGGETTTILWDFVCIVDAKGRPSEIQCIGQDVTDNIKSELALKESEHRYSNLFNLSPMPKLVYDIATLQILEVNKVACDHYGYSYEEFMKLTIREIRHESEIAKLELALKRHAQKGKFDFVGEFIHRKKNGEEIIVEVLNNTLSFKGKEAKIAIIKDITERYKHIKAIENQNEKLKKIAWTQSHLVRAPLARIIALVEVLEDESSSIDQNKKTIGYIQGSAAELDTVIRDIVNSTYPDSN